MVGVESYSSCYFDGRGIFEKREVICLANWANGKVLARWEIPKEERRKIRKKKKRSKKKR